MKIEQRGLQALDAVIQTQSFAAAAKQLFITQPAVTQRIKQLESQFGQPLLIRTLPYQATPLGEKLLSLLRRTRLLEEHLLQEIQHDLPARLSIALNRDSLETWFLRLLPSLNLFEKINIDIISDDQDVTIDHFRKGAVSTCISTYNRPLPGCECDLLGHMTYILVASPQFVKRYFDNKRGLEENLQRAPVIIFDSRDRLPQHFFQYFFNKSFTLRHFHRVPSVHLYKQFALQSYGYGWIPSLDISDELSSGELQEICPDKHWLMPLYWHYWQLPAKRYQQFIKSIKQGARQFLK
ncbi:ArgP/LysG family DNA-binding transcriptional regulator [Legionella jordanis]|uniref:LysR family transcriptional regulator n=1 Tax=Legionella jordanis TaxID=456 RepID=A0A0W0VCH2_9GAMM|nr:ArgP/LysG family DNA-binding transcriptional regulator [Legionella jordanis]KTD17826.1 LysR family transcriptional regulator [Legionella jordanis]RMX02473.1 ArgP/LysG family DNA-binding transcriptional regulator [Legionella jordanis]RMX21684.1 ArgP/LysG family DNA-binding transcriptional regulator [Legionella jordanis]VEH11237.1 LysR family transcriptional regulator [Legionella jordanis]HAT8713795.1 ArgP/LysG family DNA-binding transcriptional regulator [Legionella jordanis]